MKIFVAMVCLTALCTGCTGSGDTTVQKDQKGVRWSSPRYDPQPSTPGVHISGQAIFGSSTVR